MTTQYQIEPIDLGLPAKFTHWRPSQFESVTLACESDKRFVALSAPTGAGKSLSAVATSALLGKRTVILTSTKALQKQYGEDYNQCGMVEIKGRVNFSCTKGNFTCSEGRLLGCRDTGCPYQCDRGKALESSLVITNYAYYLSCVMHGEGLGDIGLLVLDEAHNALTELSSALEIKLDHEKNEHLYRTINCPAPPVGRPINQWSNWATTVVPQFRALFNTRKSQGHMKGLSDLDRLVSDLTRICTIPSSWIVDESQAKETIFAPLWPTEYAESSLFCGIKKVLLTSATIVPKTLTLLGIPESESLFISNDYTFDHRRSPVYLFGEHRIDHRTTPTQYAEWLSRMDSIISRRLDRKGIIHTVSYDRQQYILSNSHHQSIMYSPRGSALAPTIRQFKEAAPPAVLISPSVTTGYDFAGDQCEYQILAKVPFIDTRSPIMSARVKADPEYAHYLTAQTLCQSTGRGMRSEKDQNEVFICDSHANWFMRKPSYNSEGRNTGGYRHLFPSWFAQLVRYPNGLPEPPPPLSKQGRH